MKPKDEVARLLFDAVYTNDINALIKTAYDILDCPVIFTDISYRKLTEVYPPEPTGDPKFDKYIGPEELDLDSIRNIFENDDISSMRDIYSPIIMEQGYFSDSRRATAPIVLNGELAGYTSVLIGDKYPEGEEQQSFLDLLSMVAESVAIYLRSSNSAMEKQVSLRRFFARSLISGEVMEPMELNKWLDLLNLDLKPRYVILALGPAQMDRQNYGYYIQEQLETSGLPVLQYSSSKYLYVLLYGSVSQDFLYRQLGLISQTLERFRFHCGVSRSFEDLMQIKRYVQQADIALETGKKWRPAETLHYYRDLTIRAMSDSLIDSFGRENIRHPALDLLEAHDRESNGLYLETLRTYILSSFSSKETCEKLHIHRNTLNYRLNRIEELTGEDLSDQKTRLHLALNFLME